MLVALSTPVGSTGTWEHQEALPACWQLTDSFSTGWSKDWYLGVIPGLLHCLTSRFSRGSASQFIPLCKWEIKIFPLFANCFESCLNATKEGAESIPVAVNSNSLICFCRSRASPKWATFVCVIYCIYHHGIWALRVLSKFHWIHWVSFHCFQ